MLARLRAAGPQVGIDLERRGRFVHLDLHAAVR
jgi:hypothetical protein